MDILKKLHVNPRMDIPLVVQLKEQLTWLIASEQIQPGELLPSVRQMAEHLEVNLHTVRHAYQRLETQGLVKTRQGIGTVVISYAPQHLLAVEKQAPSHMVGVIIPSLENPLYTQYIRGIEQASRQAHTLLVVCEHHDDSEEALRQFSMLYEKKVDGILVFSFSVTDHLPHLMRPGEAFQGIPFVTIDWPEKEGFNVLCDHQGGAYHAVTHLLDHGHRRIAFITFAVDIPSVVQMRAGYQQALEEHGIALDPSQIIPVYGFDLLAGEEAARSLLKMPQIPSAVFCASDLLAIGAQKALCASGMRVPTDIAVIGINDIPLADLVQPGLSTIHQPAYEMGLTAMRMLQTLVGGKKTPERQVVMPMHPVLRESCGCERR